MGKVSSRSLIFILLRGLIFPTKYHSLPWLSVNPWDVPWAPLMGLGLLFEDGGDVTIIQAMPIRAAQTGEICGVGWGMWLAFPRVSYGDLSSGCLK